MVTASIQADQDNLFGQVEINPIVYQHWVDALGEFALSARAKYGLLQLITIDDEVWYLNEAGDLIICASIYDDSMQMIVPKGLWEWL